MRGSRLNHFQCLAKRVPNKTKEGWNNEEKGGQEEANFHQVLIERIPSRSDEGPTQLETPPSKAINEGRH